MNSNVCVYSFADATGLTKYIDDVGDYTFAGTWSSSGTYFAYPLVAVDYGNALYMCIRDNVGDNPQRVPTRNRPQSWSVMSLLYEYSTCGTDTSVGMEAYNLAVSGTNIAWAAYYLAQIGTNTGSAAYDLAGSAYALAGTALYIAESGSSTANTALFIAIAGTNAAATAQSTSDAAYRLAQIGTNTGTAALNAAATAQSTADSAFSIAVAGTNAAASAQSTANSAFSLAANGTNAAASAQSTANSAFSIAVIGTNAAASAQSTANAAYALAQIGTNVGTAAMNEAVVAHIVASAAYALAEQGTIPPPLSTLPDVSIPTPFVNQVLAFNGSLWVAMDTPSQIAPGAFTLYLENTASGTDGYDNLRATPSGLPEDVDTVAVGGGTPFVYDEGYLSGPLNRTLLDGGIWEFNTFSSVSNGANAAQIIVEAYLMAINGAETLLFTGTSAPVSSTSTTLNTFIVTQGSFATSLNDKLLVKYYWLKSSGPSVNASIFHSGSEHASHIHTPVGFSHNDLGGLQGGTTNQFYHTTLDQNQALTGNLGYPSASNPFVTVAGLNYLDGTLTSEISTAYTLAQIGTNTGTAALNAAATAQSTADAAYALAQIGTNTGTAAYNLANSAYSYGSSAFSIAVNGTNAAATAQSTADAAYALAQIGTNTGTAAYQLAQSGSNYAAAAYSMAQIGTAIPNYYYGGTMYGSLTVPSVVVGVGSTATSGTVYYDFSGPAYQTTAVSGGPLIVNGTNFKTGAEIAVVLISNGVTQPVYFGNPLSAATTWVGTTPPLQIYDKDIVIAFTCISASPVTVYACQATEP